MFDEFDNYYLELGDIEVRNQVTVQGKMGRFMAQVDEINHAATEDAVSAGANAARFYAPSDTGALKASIHYRMETPKQGVISVGTRHWRFAEYGTRPHPITGMVRFWWEKEDRMWTPGLNTISHPGSYGHYFMGHGYAVAKRELLDSMRRRYNAINVF
jgi:hypothetical protein